jgi:thiamine-monophosphate kinase
MSDRPIRDCGENRVVARFRDLARGALGPDVLVGPGDDAAVLALSEERLLLLACDIMVEGIHFRREWCTAAQLGHKAMVQNFSDIAAMGGAPAFAVASLAAPGDLPEVFVEQLAQGLVGAASQYGAALVGGDLVGSPGPIVVDVAVTGWVEREHLLRRSGARPGDAILVTGALGASAAGLTLLQHDITQPEDPSLAAALRAHREPVPRLAESHAIAATGAATAMMDLSDGLADDLPRLCAESGVGARLRAEAVPIHPACAAVAEKLGFDPFPLAVSGGEDYELLFTCPQDAVEKLADAVAEVAGPPAAQIGEIVAGDDRR